MKIAKNLASLREDTTVYRAPTGLAARLFAKAVIERGGANLFVVENDRAARELGAVARFFQPDLKTLVFPAWDSPPYERISPSPTVAAQRCAVLTTLANKPRNEPVLVVATAAALSQLVPPLSYFQGAGLNLRPGAESSIDAIQKYLEANGYSRGSIVRDPGEYAIRGGIVDLFPAGEPEPLRLDYFGDDLETIRTFDPDSQRSTSQRTELTLAPVSELDFSDAGLATLRTKYMELFGPPAGDPDYEAARARIKRQGVEQWLPLFHPALVPLTDYLDPNAMIATASGSAGAVADRMEQVRNAYEARRRHSGPDGTSRIVPPESLYMGYEDIAEANQNSPWVRFVESDGPEGRNTIIAAGASARSFAVERVDPAVDLFAAVAEYLKEGASSGRAVIVAVSSAGAVSRFQSFLSEHGIPAVGEAAGFADAAPKAVSIAVLPIDHGFSDPEVIVLTEADILGERLSRPRSRKGGAAFISEVAALSVGDLIVHIEHGVGRYAGLTTIDAGGAAHDCFELIYSGGDKILLPVENAELISRYGAESGDAALDRLGGASWQARKARARKKIMDMAEDLIRLAATRETKKAPVIESSDGGFEEFCARFPYEETDDQLAAIGDVVADLASGKPADRLICGDVGFGKTEVALRAAFLAAASGQQVAVIAPTTLLARQHYRTFEERFAGWPIKVRHLSRFVSATEASATRDELASGVCDIVVGTHALLSDRVEFKQLGLVIVDEEQRFGVKHKERLKELRADIHVLTLTATPIPRTLQMSLAGIRDLSLIATPPVDRLAVRTFVVEFDEVTIREALLREHFRGGQSYYVAPRIADLPFIERFLRASLPELRLIVAHGQMTASDLEEAMTAFYDGQADVLLSTAIVESGLDVPRANTLVVHRADKFGLAQLYQIRGRVGRSKVRAYAYLTTPEQDVMTAGADKRLKVLQSLDTLGAGFMLASHDLDMRGGGNLLGEAQSGHIREVGVELYQSMLEDAIRSLKTGDTAPREQWSPQIEVGASILIPELYIEDLATRLSIYRRLANVDSDAELEGLRVELADRFGPLPEETQRLLDVTEMKAICKRLGIAKVAAGPKGILLAFRQDTPVEADRLVAFVHQRPGSLKLRPDAKLVASGQWPDPTVRVRELGKLLNDLEKAVS